MWTGEDVLRAARGWIGTPYHHQARLRGVGVDCGGLIIGVARELGIAIEDHPGGYARLPDGQTLRALVEGQGTRLTAYAVGAVALMRWGRQPQHCAFIGWQMGRWSLVHACEDPGAVVEQPIDDLWGRRIVTDAAGPLLFQMPGVLA